jgi:hypothetical protein
MRAISFVALAACSGHGTSAPDAAVPLAGPAFTMLVCTYGTPGSPSCPFDRVGLDAVDAEVDFLAEPLTQDIYLNRMTIVAGSQGVHVVGLRFEAAPCNVNEKGWWPTIDLAPGAQQALGDTVLADASTTTQVCLVYDAIGPYQP